MSEIRPLERADLEQVTSLYEHVARSGSRTPPPGLAAYFEQTFFDYPGADPEIPSLVYVEPDGRITGFLGSSIRRFRFRDRPVRVGVSGQLVTEPEARSRAPGAFLMRAYMQGAQDLTITDTASQLVRRIWEGVGGATSHLACVGWARVFRPVEFASAFRARQRRLGAPGRGRALLAGLDGAARLVVRRLSGPAAEVESRDADAGELADALDALTAGLELRPAYDRDFLGWLLHEAEAITPRGQLRVRLVSTSDRLCGSYVYYLQPGGIGQVLQIAADERDAGLVLDDLFHDADRGGAAGLQGRVEAHLLAALAERRCLLHPSGYLALVHAADSAVLDAIQGGRALLTRLDGEWWMGHHLLRLGS